MSACEATLVNRIEEIITAHDTRGISALSPHLPAGYCDNAAGLLADADGTVFITTGFYILNAGAAETDGPPGAIAIGRALEGLGRRVLYVTDDRAAGLMGALVSTEAVLRYPICDDAESTAYASELLHAYRPALVIATERCGRTSNGTYLNMRGHDISAFTARVDALFENSIQSIGIGDGGNEIGMGNVAEFFPRYAPRLPGIAVHPCVTRTTRLIIASVADWGAYGLLAALSGLLKRNLLPSANDQCAIIERLVGLGAVDGVTGKGTATVDGHDLEANSSILHALQTLIRAS
jgi:hypothetical protein